MYQTSTNSFFVSSCTILSVLAPRILNRTASFHSASHRGAPMCHSSLSWTPNDIALVTHRDWHSSRRCVTSPVRTLLVAPKVSEKGTSHNERSAVSLSGSYSSRSWTAPPTKRRFGSKLQTGGIGTAMLLIWTGRFLKYNWPRKNSWQHQKDHSFSKSPMR